MAGSEPSDAPRSELSVVVVSYRSAGPLLRCLESLEAGTRSIATDIHVVDNASDDGTVERVHERFPDVRVSELERNRGFAVAANLGLSAARGEHLLLINPDVRVEADTLPALLAHLAEHGRVDVIAPRLEQPDGRAQGVCGMRPDARAMALRSLGLAGLAYRHGPLAGDPRLPYFLFPDEPLEVDLLVGAFLLMRRDVFARVGPMDEGYFLYGEDLDWCRRARALGVVLLHHPNIRAMHEQGSSAAQMPLASLAHFHRSAIRYFHAHEAPELPRPLAALARVSLELRYGLALLRHALRLRGAHRVYLTLEPGSRAGVAPATG